jgi:hypothetical protein
MAGSIRQGFSKRSNPRVSECKRLLAEVSAETQRLGCIWTCSDWTGVFWLGTGQFGLPGRQLLPERWEAAQGTSPVRGISGETRVPGLRRSFQLLFLSRPHLA